MKRISSRLSSPVKIFFACLLSVILFAACFQQTVLAVTSGDYVYEIADNQATITRYMGTGGDVVIPAALDGYPVIAIGSYAFYDRGPYITSLTIPAGVANLENDAFYRCLSLTALYVDPANADFMSMDGVLFNKASTTLVQYPARKPDAAYTIIPHFRAS